MNNKKIIITGAGGFLGRNLLTRLSNDARYHVTALSSKPDELRQAVSGANIDVCHKDIIEEKAAHELMARATVVNCAFPRNSAGEGMAEGLQYTKKVFEAAAAHGAAAIINISSQSVYSQKRTETAYEQTPICLESPYAVGKYAVELLLSSICSGKNIRYTNLRMASLIGPRFHQRVVNRMILKIINNEEVTVVQQNRKMGFLDVADAVNAILSVADCPEAQWKPIYNVGNGKGYTAEEIYLAIKTVLEASGYAVKEPVIEQGEDDANSAVSYELLHLDTGFEPEISLSESIRMILLDLTGETGGA